jgi:surfeit locus 1 family protein
MPIRLFSREFSPSWLMTGITLALLAMFVSLGRWQWDRASLKELQWQAFESGGGKPMPLGSRGLDRIGRFQRVYFTGQFEPERQFLLDNRTHAGQPGYEVITPFVLADGRRVLVNRGWLAFTGYRDRLPDLSMTPAEVDATSGITARVDDLPQSGLASGRAAPEPGPVWPKLTSFPQHAELQRSLGTPIEPRLLLLDAEVKGGYLRDWHPPGVPPSRHLSYAIQWWGFGVVLLVLYFALNLRKVP